MVYTLRAILRITISIGVVAGLLLWFYCSVQGEWKLALIAAAIYAFSLVMLA